MPAYNEAATIQAVVSRVLQQPEVGQLVIVDDAARIFYKLAWTIPVMNPSSLDLARQRQPSWVVLSKPDVYDIHASLREWLTRRGGQLETNFPSFQVYRFSKSQNP
jgi:hypothetical protein